MYEVFLNERRLILTGTPDQVIVDKKIRITRAITRMQLTDEVSQFLTGEEECLLLQGDVYRLWEWFRRGFKELPAAGGIVRSPKGVLFIFRRGKWDLPKGKIDNNESPREAAMREVTEETGLTKLSITAPCRSTWHIYLSDYPEKKKEWILKETHWFFMQASADEKSCPETAEDIEEVRWFPPEEVGEVLQNTYASLKNLIRLAYA